METPSTNNNYVFIKNLGKIIDSSLNPSNVTYRYILVSQNGRMTNIGFKRTIIDNEFFRAITLTITSNEIVAEVDINNSEVTPLPYILRLYGKITMEDKNGVITTKNILFENSIFDVNKPLMLTYNEHEIDFRIDPVVNSLELFKQEILTHIKELAHVHYTVGDYVDAVFVTNYKTYDTDDLDSADGNYYFGTDLSMIERLPYLTKLTFTEVEKKKLDLILCNTFNLNLKDKDDLFKFDEVFKMGTDKDGLFLLENLPIKMVTFNMLHKGI